MLSKIFASALLLVAASNAIYLREDETEVVDDVSVDDATMANGRWWTADNRPGNKGGSENSLSKRGGLNAGGLGRGNDDDDDGEETDGEDDDDEAEGSGLGSANRRANANPTGTATGFNRLQSGEPFQRPESSQANPRANATPKGTAKGFNRINGGGSDDSSSGDTDMVIIDVDDA